MANRSNCKLEKGGFYNNMGNLIIKKIKSFPFVNFQYHLNLDFGRQPF